MIINKSGIFIRPSVGSLRVMGRATQGVRLINLKESDEIAAVSKIDVEEDVPEEAVISGNTESHVPIVNDEIDKSDQLLHQPENDEENNEDDKKIVNPGDNGKDIV
jgi:DNA gyrase subunit A